MNPIELFSVPESDSGGDEAALRAGGSGPDM